MTGPPASSHGAGRVTDFLAGIRGRMIVLLMAAGIPVIVIATGNALQGQEAALAEGRRQVLAAREIGLAQGGVTLDGLDDLLHALARVDSVRSGEAPACDELLRRILELHPGRYGSLWVLGASGERTCGAASEAPLPDAARMLRAATTGTLALGDFVPARDAAPMLLPFALPVPEPGRPLLTIAGTLLPDAFTPPGMRQATGQQAWLVDRDGTAFPLGVATQALAPPAATLREATADQGVLVARSNGGETVAYAVATLAPDLRLAVGQPFAPVREAAWSTLLQRLAELAAFLVVCLATIVIGADLAMVRPLHSLAQRVKRWRPGVAFERLPWTTEPREVIELEEAFDDAARTLARREADLEAALAQRDALMAEIHHRVKNNLQIVSSLLNLQANRIADPEAQAEFRAARNRVRALATLHRHLYLQHSFEAIALKPFLEELALQQFTALGEVPGERIALRVDAVDLSLSTDQAVSVALLVTEAMTNAVAHAFPDEGRGTVTVIVAREGDDVVVGIGDDGIGLAPGGPGGLGLQLLDGFARQLGGRLSRRPGPGTAWTVRFPLRERAEPPRRPEVSRAAA